MNKDLLDQVLQMPPNERVTFAELVLAGLDYKDKEIRQAWLNEVNDRMKAVKEGKTKLLDFESLYHVD